MNLLEYAQKTVLDLEKAKSDENFASIFIEAKMKCFKLYHNQIITSSSHGINFFNNIIKYWDNPDSYYTPDTKYKKIEPDYEQNFITLLNHNKNEAI